MALDGLTEFDEEMNRLNTEVKDEFEPLYKVIGDNKIAVSKKEGSVWESKLRFSQKILEEQKKEWDEITNVFLGKDRPTSEKDTESTKLVKKTKDFENLIWTNVNGISRETIMKLPSIEITPESNVNEPFAKIYQKGLNNYLGLTGNNGINLKEKLKKCDLSAQITNKGILRLDWHKEDTNQEVILNSIKKIEAELVEAKDTNEIKEIEGRLFALNQKLVGSGISGLQLVNIDPTRLFIDPNSQLESCLDADWIIEERTELASVIKAKYGTEEGTVYAGKKSQIGSEEKAAKEDKLIYICGEQEEDYDEELKTVTTYYIWDKLKKRIYLYEKGKWEYPLWVWEDPLGLKQFFPYFILNYNFAPNNNITPSECSYYLPIQNEINKINTQISIARDRAFNVLVYNKNIIDNEDVAKLNSGKKNIALGLKLPPEMPPKDAFSPLPTPSLQEGSLLNKNDLYAQLQKMSSADALSRGEQYKTNTTNLAIQQYSGSKKIIVGLRIDQILSFYCKLAKEVLGLMLVNFDIVKWNELVGAEMAQFIVNNPKPFNEVEYNFVGDDTIEPTSNAKKQEAIQLSQILGQFASATPAVSIVMLKMISRAFNEVNINDDDWRMIFASLQQQQAQPQPQPSGQPKQQPQRQQMVAQAVRM